MDTLDILEHQPERLLEIRGITENKLEDIKLLMQKTVCSKEL